MKKRNRMLLTAVLVLAVVLNMATGVLATEEEHVHNWVLKSSGSRGHTMTCDGCNQSKLEDHTIDSSSETCTVCGFYEHIHNWQCAWSDDYWHCMVCSGCQEEKTLSHTKDSAGVCKVCGHMPHKHIWQYTQGVNYADSHGMHCTQCAATTIQDHIYGNDGKCTVCGNTPPHEHRWEWDSSKTSFVYDHFMICSCGATTTEPHQLFAWDGKVGNFSGHRFLCGICGFAWIFEHSYDPEYYNAERCTECGYQGQGNTVPQTKPSGNTPAETRPTESKPKETTPAETKPAESKPTETTPAVTEPAETQPIETTPAVTEPAETQPTETTPIVTEAASEATPLEPATPDSAPQDTAKRDAPRSGSVWVWVIPAAVGGLVAAVLLLKKRSR